MKKVVLLLSLALLVGQVQAVGNVTKVCGGLTTASGVGYLLARYFHQRDMRSFQQAQKRGLLMPARRIALQKAIDRAAWWQHKLGWATTFGVGAAALSGVYDAWRALQASRTLPVAPQPGSKPAGERVQSEINSLSRAYEQQPIESFNLQGMINYLRRNKLDYTYKHNDHLFSELKSYQDKKLINNIQDIFRQNGDERINKKIRILYVAHKLGRAFYELSKRLSKNTVSHVKESDLIQWATLYYRLKALNRHSKTSYEYHTGYGLPLNYSGYFSAINFTDSLGGLMGTTCFNEGKGAVDIPEIEKKYGITLDKNRPAEW